MTDHESPRARPHWNECRGTVDSVRDLLTPRRWRESDARAAGIRHPHRPGAAGTPRREHHHDLYPRPESRVGRGEEPGGPDVRPMTPPAASAGITHRDTLRDAAAYLDRPRLRRADGSDWIGRPGSQAAGSGPARVYAAGVRRGWHYYADQHIQWPNSSSPPRRVARRRGLVSGASA